MIGCRLRYLAVLTASILYYLGNGEWLSWILLLVCLGLPWLSLILSLPAILSLRVQPTGLPIIQQHQPARLWLLGSCKYPMPPFRGGILLESCFTGKSTRYSPDDGLDTRHCGGFLVRAERVQVYDYLGLFSFRVKEVREFSLRIRPQPLTSALSPDIPEPLAYRPNPALVSEAEELRPYRPGDSPNRMHWKLSAKTGTLMFREPMEPLYKPPVLTLTLSGTLEELDTKLGQFLWNGSQLLAQNILFSLHLTTGLGTSTILISTEAELLSALDALLLSPVVIDSGN